MSVADSDIVYYGSAVMPEGDATTAIGGAIDTTTRVVFTPLDVAGEIEIVSTAAADTMAMTVTGRNPAGELIADTQALNGTTPVALTGTFERLEKAELAAAATGTVIVRKAGNGGDLMIFEPGLLMIRRVFIGVVADPAGGASKTWHEKIFIANTHATLALTQATVTLTDATGAIRFGLAATLDDTDTNGAGNDRLVAPAGVTLNVAGKNVANAQNLSPGAAQGVWLSLTRAAGAPAINTTFQLAAQGVST